MRIQTLEDNLNELYQPGDFKDFGPSGLIVKGRNEVKRGFTAVSLSARIVKEAAKRSADFLVVHHPHGFWDNQSKKIKGGFRENLASLLKNDINLLAYHLPMDGHPQIGNNIGIIKILRMNCIGGFEPQGRFFTGLVGEFEKSMSFSHFTELVRTKIGEINFSFAFGKKTVKRVAVCSGGAAGLTRKAMATGAQVFLTGEAKEDTFVLCQDEKFNFLACGHNRTELFGPGFLAKHMKEQYGLGAEFLPSACPV